MPFRDVVGHHRLVGLLSRSVERGSLPPSLIFSGPSGVGKRFAAIATAQALNCVNNSAPAFDACGTCPTCRRIERSIHPDVVVVEPGETGSIKVDQVRDIIDRAGYRPFEAKRRVVIFDDADTLVAAAQHALLKTLEEPPASSTFILVTSRPDALLPTVRSRCPRLRFGTLDTADVRVVLMRRGCSETEARALAATAEGSVRRALDASPGSDLVQAREAAIHMLSEASISDDPRRRLEAARNLVGKAGGTSDRDTLAMELRAMASLVRDVELLATSLEGRDLANADAQRELQKLTGFRGRRGVHAFEAIDRALEALERNAGVKSVADWVALQL